ncbi:hypothetical protein QBC39DRAFT_340864 [Podospora conica]|nr:hypothetical protein QBC39DRAFT_340864 [Schizothecium conicum]
MSNRMYQPKSSSKIVASPNREDDDNKDDAPDGPVRLVTEDDSPAMECTSAPSTGIRKSPASTSHQELEDHDRQPQLQDPTTTTTPTSSPSESHSTHHNPRRGVSEFTTPALDGGADLPAWAMAALQETLEQPWRAHFDGQDGAEGSELSMRNHPDFARERDIVPFYDGRLKVCYGEGSISA